jgi:hypothetical protein
MCTRQSGNVTRARATKSPSDATLTSYNSFPRMGRWSQYKWTFSGRFRGRNMEIDSAGDLRSVYEGDPDCTVENCNGTLFFLLAFVSSVTASAIDVH